MARVLAGVLALLGLLPVANWIAGGHAAPWYQDRLDGWLSGGAIVVGVAIIASIALRRWPHLWQGGAWSRVGARWQQGGMRADICLAAIALGVGIAVAHAVLSARPLLIDEIIQVYQARIFAAGRLWLDAPLHPEFTSSQHLLDWGGKVFGQFPAGGAAFLALGTLVGAEWIVGPLASALCVFLFSRVVRRIEPRPGTAIAAVLLFGAAPFVVFLGASMMNHITTTAALLAAALALSRATSGLDARTGDAFLAGLALGVAATIRPLDAAAFAIPTAAWLGWRARRGGPHLVALLASGAGVLIPLALLLAVNQAQTGDAFTFGYIAMWGRSHELGFHATPWGDVHTPLRGLELVNLYLLRLQTYLYESAAPSLLFATAALALARRLTAFDRWMIVSTILLLTGYFAYWHDGFYLGPRFLLPVIPLVALWTARLPAVMADRGVSDAARRTMVIAGCASLLLGGVTLLPLRAQQYHNGMLSLRTDFDAEARRAGVTGAIVLVRESWGAQVMARLWARGVTRSDAEMLYRSADICRLDLVLDSAEARGDSAAAVLRAVAPLRADSARLVAMRFATDTTPRVLPGAIMPARCVRRILEDRAGFTLFPPLLLVRDTSNIYLRDLHARDSLVITPHESRPIFLLVKPPEVGAAVRFLPVNRDSMRREWQDDGR